MGQKEKLISNDLKLTILMKPYGNLWKIEDDTEQWLHVEKVTQATRFSARS